MKLHELRQLALVITCSLSILSCEDEKKVVDPPEDLPPVEIATKGHSQLSQEFSDVKTALMTEIFAIYDLKSAEGLAAGKDRHKATLKSLIKEAQALVAPTEEEKATIRVARNEQQDRHDEQLGDVMRKINNHPDGEAIHTILGEIFGDVELRKVSQDFDELYELDREWEGQ